MALNIAICDDEKSDREILLSYIHAACTALHIKEQTIVFSSGEDFLDAYKNTPFDIVFMDIYMDGINGMETILDACRTQPCQFVFTTASSEHALEAFSLNAAHYLLKPLNRDLVREALKRCLIRLPQADVKVLEVKTLQGIIPISMDSIIYIEVSNNVCTIHTKKNSVQTYMSLAALYELLDDACFIRVQRSFVVNMHFIDSFFFDHIVLQNGKEITLSRLNRADLKQQYQQFLFRLAGS
ncbi:MAG: LytTR family DNA-binding domain-containing protein [Clostridium sp.]|nr:LytTR family DNA-binding domain-containing protein [Clostridium sp.]